MPGISLPVGLPSPDDPDVVRQLSRRRREKGPGDSLQVRVEREALRLRVLSWALQRDPDLVVPHLDGPLANGAMQTLSVDALRAIDRVVLDALAAALPPPGVLAPIIGAGPHFGPLPPQARALLRAVAVDVLSVSEDTGLGLPDVDEDRDDATALTFVLEALVRMSPGAGVYR